MMSSSSNSAESHSNSSFSETAEVRLVSGWPMSWLWPQSDYKMAYVFVSSRIYWKEAKEDRTNEPQSLLDFRKSDSIELVRLGDDKKWDDVKDYVKIDDCEGRRRITVSGILRGRTALNKAYHGWNVQIEIKHNAPEQIKIWQNQIQARIVPWSLLKEEAKLYASGERSSPDEKLDEILSLLIRSCDDRKRFSKPTGQAEGTWSKLPEEMEKLSMMDKVISQSTGAVGAGVAWTTLLARQESVKETAKLVGDAARVAGGVSNIFQLLALAAKGVSMVAEANRGVNALPVTLGRIGFLLEYVLNCMAEIIKPSQSVKDVDIDFMFDALKQTVLTMELAETQLLRGKGRQIINAADVKKVEEKEEELRQKAVIARNTWNRLTVTEIVNQLKEDNELWNDDLLHARPSLSAFFTGRTKELKTLREILNKQGSAVITQYGGVGKTQLMIALANQAEHDEQEPREVFWVSADGGEKDVIESLARLVEKLRRKKLDEEERRNVYLVVTALKWGLGRRKRRWLLCLDNADDGKVNGILNRVCRIAGEAEGKGWVVVTSRQGKPHVWSEMMSEQKLVLQPFSTEDSMVALWRQVRKIKTNVENDVSVMEAIKELENENSAEYRAMQELCGHEGRCSLGGLPLALVQAGSYMAQFECSFAEYLNLFKDTREMEEWQDIMMNTEDVESIREAQRSVWTTWKISVQKLTNQAYSVLRSMAMLGSNGVERTLVQGILKEVTTVQSSSPEMMFHKFVMKELVHGSSLISQDGGERVVYKMHRLVQEFILIDMKRGSALWNKVYHVALVTVHENVETELEKDGNSFSSFPEIFGSHHRELATHTTALVAHHTFPEHGAEIRHLSKVEDIHRYSGMLMEFMGKTEKEVQVWECLLNIARNRKPAERRRVSDESSVDVEIEKKYFLAYVYNALGSALIRDERFSDAALKLEQSLELCPVMCGHNVHQTNMAASLENLGIVYLELGKLDKALENHEKSLEMYLAIHGDDKPHPDIAASLNNVGNLYDRLDKPDKALEKHQQSLEMYTAVHGRVKPHPDFARVLNNLGKDYEGLGRFDKALDLYKQSLDMKMVIYGHDKPHPQIASSLSNLGKAYQGLGKFDKALENYERSMKMRLAIHGHEKLHPDIAESLSNLGSVYEGLGNLEKALEKHEKSLEIRLAIHGHGKHHLDVSVSLSNLGNVYERMGKLDKALEMYLESHKMVLSIRGYNKPHRAIAVSLRNLGNVYLELGELAEALENHEKSSEMYRAIHGDDKAHPDIALSLRSLGNVYEELYELDKALEKHEQSLEMFKVIHGHDKRHSDIAASYSNLGNVYEEHGELNKALEMHKKSLEIYVAIHGPDRPHPDIAASLRNLGNVYGGLCELEKALEKHEEGLKMYIAIHGDDKPHHDIAASLNRIGNVYERRGNLDNALEMYEQSLQMELAIHAHRKPHRAIARLLSNLGNVYRQQGELETALEKLEESLKMKLLIHGHGKPHLDIVMSLSYLGNVYEELCELEKAIEHHEKSLEMLQVIYGPRNLHPHMAISHSNLGNAYQKQGRLDKALENHELSLEMRLAMYNADSFHPDIASSLGHLGSIHKQLGKMDKALENHEKSLEMYLAIHGDDKPHPDIAATLNNLGNVYQELGDLEEALDKHEQSLKMRIAIHGDDKPHQDIATSLNNVGNVYEELGSLEKALEMLKQSLAMFQAVHGRDKPHPDIAAALTNLGNVYEQLNKLDKALESHEQSLEMFLAVFGHDEPHPYTAMSLSNVGHVYDGLGKLQKALEKHEWSLEMKLAIYGVDEPHPGTAMSLRNIGIIHHKLKRLNQAAEFLERSLEMLQIVHGENLDHPHIMKVLSDLADVRKDEERHNQASETGERNTETDKTSLGEGGTMQN